MLYKVIKKKMQLGKCGSRSPWKYFHSLKVIFNLLKGIMTEKESSMIERYGFTLVSLYEKVSYAPYTCCNPILPGCVVGKSILGLCVYSLIHCSLTMNLTHPCYVTRWVSHAKSCVGWDAVCPSSPGSPVAASPWRQHFLVFVASSAFLPVPPTSCSNSALCFHSQWYFPKVVPNIVSICDRLKKLQRKISYFHLSS